MPKDLREKAFGALGARCVLQKKQRLLVCQDMTMMLTRVAGVRRVHPIEYREEEHFYDWKRI